MDPIIPIIVALVLALFGGLALRGRGGRRPHFVIGGFGSPAVNMSVDFVNAFKNSRIFWLILLVIGMDLNETTYRKVLSRLVSKAKLVLPKPEWRMMGGGNNRLDVMNQNRAVWNNARAYVNDRIRNVIRKLKIQDFLTIWIVSWQGAHRHPALQSLRELRPHLPLQLVLGLFVIPGPQDPERRTAIRDNPRHASDAVEEGLIKVAIILDDGVEMVVTQDQAAQAIVDGRGVGMTALDRRTAKGLTGIFAAPWQFPKGQKANPDVVRDMADYGPLSGLSFGCQHLPNPEESRLKAIWRRITGRAPAWLVEELISTALVAAVDAMSIRPGNSSVEAVPNPDGRVLGIQIPIPVTDRRWGQIRPVIVSNITARYPDINILVSAGNGEPEFGVTGYRYFIQATNWWSLLDKEIPDPIRKIMASRDIRAALPAPRDSAVELAEAAAAALGTRS